MSKVPRIMITATSSGAGKTTLTLAVLAALQKRSRNPVAFKCGPDYIDPMFHREVMGIPSYNLDLFFTSEQVVRGLLCEHTHNHDIAVIEGVMGYYDGMGVTDRASSYNIAEVTRTPAVLVVNAKGTALSLGAEINGFLNFRKPSLISGVILNSCSEALYSMLKEPLEAETGVKLLGYFPSLSDCRLESRHLGLVTAAEIGGIKEKIRRLGEQAEKSIDLDVLIEIASSTCALEGSLLEIKSVCPTGPGHAGAKRPRIAVARDRAFCFYYADNLNLLEQFGAELVPFSPLNDRALPPGTSAVYLGGGYPELYARTLSKNIDMLASIRSAAENGMPILAECGGFLYLHKNLEDDSGEKYPMAGVYDADGVKTPRLQRFGYIRLTADKDTLLCSEGNTIPAHEFHYWDSSQPGTACTARKPDGRSWQCVISNKNVFAGFPHLYFYGNPSFAERFVQAAAEYENKV